MGGGDVCGKLTGDQVTVLGFFNPHHSTTISGPRAADNKDPSSLPSFGKVLVFLFTEKRTHRSSPCVKGFEGSNKKIIERFMLAGGMEGGS